MSASSTVENYLKAIYMGEMRLAPGQTLMPAIGQLRSGMVVEIEYQRGSNGLLLRQLKID